MQPVMASRVMDHLPNDTICGPRHSLTGQRHSQASRKKWQPPV
jgi:hypothetical protein